MAKVVPFPLARRRAFIRGQAAWIGGMSPEGAEGTLRRQLEIQRQALTSKGVDPERVAVEVSALEAAIRCELWRVILTPGGAA